MSENEKIEQLIKDHDELMVKVDSLNKRLSNIEEIFVCFTDEIDKKLEMLRENNNLFATEIQKLGGFNED